MSSKSETASFTVDLARALGTAGEQEYKRLLRVLTAAQGLFALVPVASDFPVEARDALLERLTEDLAVYGIAFHVARLSRERWDVLQALAAIAPPTGTPAVLAVVGLEETPGLVLEPGSPPRRPPTLALLNHARESIRAQFPFPLLLWCASAAFVALQEQAPDFYDHFIGLAEFLYAGPHQSLGERIEETLPVGHAVAPSTISPPDSPTAVAFYETLLARHPEPSSARARALLGWAEALLGLQTKDVRVHLPQALKATEEALSILSQDKLPEETARGQVLMGLILSDLPTDDRATNLSKAIACYEAALQVYTEHDFPVQWALTQSNLGTAYQQLPNGDHATNLQQAIACYEVALRVFTENDFPLQWAMIHHKLGFVYDQLPSGDRELNLQRAITCYKMALRILTERDFPMEWAITQNNLGTIYQALPRGNRQANLQQAIACYEAALRIYTERDFPVDWAMIQHNLGAAYRVLSAGGHQEYLQQAIAYYEAAVRGYKIVGLLEEATQDEQILASLKQQR